MIVKRMTGRAERAKTSDSRREPAAAAIRTPQDHGEPHFQERVTRGAVMDGGTVGLLRARCGRRNGLQSLARVFLQAAMQEGANGWRHGRRQERPVRSARITAASVSGTRRVKGAFPSTFIQHAAEAQMSDRLSQACTRCSGLMYAAVPRMTPIPVIIAGDVIVADIERGENSTRSAPRSVPSRGQSSTSRGRWPTLTLPA